MASRLNTHTHTHTHTHTQREYLPVTAAAGVFIATATATFSLGHGLRTCCSTKVNSALRLSGSLNPVRVSDEVRALICLQCFDAVGWAAGRASGLKKTEWWGAGVVIYLEQGADLHI